MSSIVSTKLAFRVVLGDRIRERMRRGPVSHPVHMSVVEGSIKRMHLMVRIDPIHIIMIRFIGRLSIVQLRCPAVQVSEAHLHPGSRRVLQRVGKAVSAEAFYG